jgi:microcystin degradation protein MlrC
MQETNSFSPTQTTLETFAAYYLLRGDEILTGYGDAQVEVPAFLDVLRQAGATPVPLLAASAASGGPVAPDTFATLLDELVDRLRRALPVDGVLLALHGAMAVADDPDAEGTILAAVRSLVGPDVPIAVSLDLHAHVTPRMVEAASVILGYHAYPHIDMYETGVRAATLLIEMVQGRRHPVMALAKRPMVLSAVAARTADGPLKEVAEAARALEAAGRILDAALFPVQPWLDVPDLGFAVLVVTDGDPAAAQHAAEHLAEMAWARRRRCEPDLVALDEAIRTALDAREGLTVVADAGDAPSSGAPADSPAVLSALLAAGADRAARLTYLTLCDAAAAAQAAARGVGQEVTLRLGHAVSPGTPVAVTGRVQTLSDGVYVLSGAGARGLEMHMGLTAVLALGQLRLAIRSLPGLEWDPALYVAVGLDPREAGLVFVKSPAHFRVSFGPIAQRVLVADTPGPACVNMRRVPFRRVTRPLYPLDEL